MYLIAIRSEDNVLHDVSDSLADFLQENLFYQEQGIAWTGCSSVAQLKQNNHLHLHPQAI